MTDEEVLDNALPWIEELLRRKMLGVQIRIPATAVTPEKIAHAWLDRTDHLALKDQLLLFVSNWSIEEPARRLEKAFRCQHNQAPASLLKGPLRNRRRDQDFPFRRDPGNRRGEGTLAAALVRQ